MMCHLQIQNFRGGIPHLQRTAQASLSGSEQQPAGCYSSRGLCRPEPVSAGAQPEPSPLQPLCGDRLEHGSPLELPGDPESTGPVGQQSHLFAPAHFLLPEQLADAPAFQQLPGGHPQLHPFGFRAAGGARPDAQCPQVSVRRGPPRAGLPAQSCSPAGREPVHVHMRNWTFCSVAQQVTESHQRRREPRVRLPGQHEKHVLACRGDDDSGMPRERCCRRSRSADLLCLLRYSPGLHRPHLPLCTLPQPQRHQEAHLWHARRLQGGVGRLPLPLRNGLWPQVITGLQQRWCVRGHFAVFSDETDFLTPTHIYK